MKRFANVQLFAAQSATQAVTAEERKECVELLTDVLISVTAAIRAYNDGRFDHGTDMCEEAAGQLKAVYNR